MARVDSLVNAQRERTSVHEAVHATFHVFEVEGQTILQIDTYGRADRQIPGKISQSLQFGPEGLKSLRKILDEIAR
jgi:hypothetical protein